MMALWMGPVLMIAVAVEAMWPPLMRLALALIKLDANDCVVREGTR